MWLATMAYMYTACPVRVTIFSTGGKFQPVSNFTELHTLTLAARSYALQHHRLSFVPSLIFRSSAVDQTVCYVKVIASKDSQNFVYFINDAMKAEMDRLILILI